MTPHGNDPAFPYRDWDKDMEIGLTKREEFAKAAMTGLLAGCVRKGQEWNSQFLAETSVHMADELLAALHKTEKSGE